MLGAAKSELYYERSNFGERFSANGTGSALSPKRISANGDFGENVPSDFEVPYNFAFMDQVRIPTFYLHT